MTALRLLRSPALSRSTVDRMEPLRNDAHRLARCWRSALVVVVDAQGRTPVGEDGAGGQRLALRPATTLGDSVPPDGVLLGEQDGAAYWAVPGEPAPSDESGWVDLRACGAELDDTGAGLLTTAVAVLGWHAANLFCGLDGSPTDPVRAGWARACRAHGHEEYPRTDPAVICLVHDGADHVLLARQPTWPAGRYSVLAGFVEAGESLEACVVREAFEEVGVRVRDIGYLGSQAWPFPRSIMVGFSAVADRGSPLRPAHGEIEHARWVGRAELRAALQRGTWTDRAGWGATADAGLLLPGPVSIARAMLDSWAAGG